MLQLTAIPAIAFIGGVGNLFGGFVGPTLVGWLDSVTHSFTIGFSVLAVAGIVGGLLVLLTQTRARPEIRELASLGS